MVDNNIKVVTYNEYDRIETKIPNIQNAIIEVRETTILLDKKRIREATQKQCDNCKKTNYNENCHKCKLYKLALRLLS